VRLSAATGVGAASSDFGRRSAPLAGPWSARGSPGTAGADVGRGRPPFQAVHPFFFLCVFREEEEDREERERRGGSE